MNDITIVLIEHPASATKPLCVYSQERLAHEPAMLTHDDLVNESMRPQRLSDVSFPHRRLQSVGMVAPGEGMRVWLDATTRLLVDAGDERAVLSFANPHPVHALRLSLMREGGVLEHVSTLAPRAFESCSAAAVTIDHTSVLVIEQVPAPGWFSGPVESAA
jgi:hypothetical protein